MSPVHRIFFFESSLFLYIPAMSHSREKKKIKNAGKNTVLNTQKNGVQKRERVLFVLEYRIVVWVSTGAAAVFIVLLFHVSITQSTAKNL